MFCSFWTQYRIKENQSTLALGLKFKKSLWVGIFERWFRPSNLDFAENSAIHWFKNYWHIQIASSVHKPLINMVWGREALYQLDWRHHALTLRNDKIDDNIMWPNIWKELTLPTKNGQIVALFGGKRNKILDEECNLVMD